MWRRFRSRTRVIYRGGGRRRGYGASSKKIQKAYVVGALVFIFAFFMAPAFRQLVEEKFNQWFPRLRA